MFPGLISSSNCYLNKPHKKKAVCIIDVWSFKLRTEGNDWSGNIVMTVGTWHVVVSVRLLWFILSIPPTTPLLSASCLYYPAHMAPRGLKVSPITVQDKLHAHRTCEQSGRKATSIYSRATGCWPNVGWEVFKERCIIVNLKKETVRFLKIMNDSVDTHSSNLLHYVTLALPMNYKTDSGAE